MSSDARRLTVCQAATNCGGCLPLVVVLGVFALILLAFYLLLSLRLPEDAPLARMYRTEADIAFLKKAIEHCREVKGAYPPAGHEGLLEATRVLSAKADYVPGGPPPDAWGRPYHYVPHAQYGEPQWQALRSGDAYCAPDTYQLYSEGADGDPGLDDAVKQQDNIRSWDSSKTWRAVYRDANEAFMKTRKGGS